MNFGPRQLHFFMMLLLTVCVVYFQTYCIARLGSNWLHIDLVSIVMVYMAIEHFLLGSFLRLMLAGLLMQMFSGAPDGFFIMYYLLVLVFANIISRRLVLHDKASQVLTFIGIFLVKFLLLYGVFYKMGKLPSPWVFIQVSLPSIVLTVIFSIPFFWFLTWLDGLFKFASTRERKQEMIDTF